VGRSVADHKTLDIPALLLVGGKGTRLRSVVPSAPKPMAAVGGRSFLELLVQQLRVQGIRRLVMCSGYLADQIEEKFGDGRAWDVSIAYSREPEPMGTGGALRLAQSYLAEGADFLVMNGDSFLEIDLARLVQFHRERAGLASMAVVPVEDAGRYGTVRIDANGRVIGFSEKTGNNAPGVINAGVYVFNRAIFDHISPGPTSLERDVFPKVLAHGVHAFEQNGMFIDIGTPEDYARAQMICDRLYAAAFGQLRAQYGE
jgi:D-glycero-alpha-D-manno-heptose 1-phosphate guanylyltransferase